MNQKVSIDLGFMQKQNNQIKSLLPYTKRNTEGRDANLIKSWEK